MFRKLLTVSFTLAACSSVAFAGPAYKGERPVVYKGQVPLPPPCFLAGPYVGASGGPRVNNTGAPSVYQGLEGVASVGWGWMIQDFYLAGEFFVGDSIKLKNYDVPNDGSVRTTWNGGISAIAGIMLTDTILAFARGGASRAHFRAQPPDPCNCNNGTTGNGWHVGLGGQANLCGPWDIRGEYLYSQFTSISSIGTPRSSQFTLGLVYKFI